MILLKGEYLEELRNGRSTIATIKDYIATTYKVDKEDFTLTYRYYEAEDVYEVEGKVSYDKPIQKNT